MHQVYLPSVPTFGLSTPFSVLAPSFSLRYILKYIHKYRHGTYITRYRFVLRNVRTSTSTICSNCFGTLFLYQQYDTFSTSETFSDKKNTGGFLLKRRCPARKLSRRKPYRNNHAAAQT